MDFGNWKRREFTTRGADPTVVVEWAFREGSHSMVIAEFQGVYTMSINGGEGYHSDSSEDIHKLLEMKWEQEQERLAAADPFGGHDPFYGGR